MVLATIIFACCLTVGVASAAASDNQYPDLGSAPDFGGNFTLPSDFNGSFSGGGPDDFPPGNGTFPDDGNFQGGNMTRPDFSGAPVDPNTINQQSTASQADYTLIIAGLAVGAVVIVAVVVVVLKRRKKSSDQAGAFGEVPSAPAAP